METQTAVGDDGEMSKWKNCVRGVVSKATDISFIVSKPRKHRVDEEHVAASF